MSGFHEDLVIEGDTVGQALAALLKARGLLITGQAWADSDETARVFDQLGRLADQYFATTDQPVSLTFKEAHRKTNPLLSLDDPDNPLIDLIFGLLTYRVVILEVDKMGITTDNGTYEVTLYRTSLYIGTLCLWRTGWI